MLEKIHVEGTSKGEIVVYALSTCVWCKKAKNYLNTLKIAYDYVDVDMLSSEDGNEVRKYLKDHCNSSSFPVILINEHCILGFDERKMSEALENAEQ